MTDNESTNTSQASPAAQVSENTERNASISFRVALCFTLYLAGILTQIALFITVAIYGVHNEPPQLIYALAVMIVLGFIMMRSSVWLLPLVVRLCGIRYTKHYGSH